MILMMTTEDVGDAEGALNGFRNSKSVSVEAPNGFLHHEREREWVRERERTREREPSGVSVFEFFLCGIV